MRKFVFLRLMRPFEPLLILFALGCASKQAPFVIEKVEPELSLEHLTVEDQALEDVLATPLVFELPPNEQVAAWNRARYFFKSQTASSKEQSDAIGNGPNETYHYLVRRTLKNALSRYEVECIAKSPALQTMADRNARNLARFLRDGTLEVSLLAK